MTAVPGDGAPAAGAGAAPVCPRHPSREAYVRCQRCERPVCPECQRPAAVGVQCVDCVREGAKTVRGPRTVLGGRAGDDRPVITQVLIGLNAVVFVLQWTLGTAFTDRFSFFPPLALSEPWRFLTSAFEHAQGNPLHILLNMYALWMVGPYLESLFGRARYTGLYLVSALGGSVGFFLLADPLGDGWRSQMVGASGAVFGLFAAFFVVNRRLGRDSTGIAVLIGINLLLGFVINGVAWQGHLGGLVTGGVTAFGLAVLAQRGKARLQPLVLVTVVALLLLLTALKVAMVPTGLLA